MTAYPKPARVGTIGNDWDQLRFDGGVDLDLRIAVIGIPIDIFLGLLGSIDTHLGRPGEFASAVNNAGFQNTRAEFRAVVETRDALRESIRVIRHVACARDAVNQIERNVDVAEMLMIIPRSEERRVGKECRSRWSPY